MTTRRKDKPRTLYSGKASKAFWNRIRDIEDETAHSIAYNAGVTLQNVEEQCLAIIKAALPPKRKAIK